MVVVTLEIARTGFSTPLDTGITVGSICTGTVTPPVFDVVMVRSSSAIPAEIAFCSSRLSGCFIIVFQ